MKKTAAMLRISLVSAIVLVLVLTGCSKDSAASPTSTTKTTTTAAATTSVTANTTTKAAATTTTLPKTTNPVTTTATTSPAVSLTAQAIVANMTVAITSPAIKSYGVGMVMSGTINMAGTAGGQTVNINMTTTGTGTGDIDLAGNQSKVITLMQTESDSPQVPKSALQTFSYVSSGFVYSGINDGSGTTTWTKTKAPGKAGAAPDTTTLHDVVDMLTGASVEKLGEEQVNGQAAYVIRVTPDMNKLLSIALDSLSGEGIDTTGITASAIKSFSMKMWISKDGFLLLKEEDQMKMLLDGSAMGAPGFAMTWTMTEATSYTYNTPVTITVPAQALAAPLS